MKAKGWISKPRTISADNPCRQVGKDDYQEVVRNLAKKSCERIISYPVRRPLIE